MVSKNNSKMLILFQKAGFTLAEVLIVIAIIGVIAQITIPTLVQNVQERVTVTQLKKAYSTLSQAYTLSVQENGTPDNWSLSADYAGSKAIMDNLSKNMNITKKCEAEVGCFAPVMYKLLNGNDWSNFYSELNNSKVQLSDGSSLITSSYENCNFIYGTSAALQNVCGWIGVDTNGFKKPNTLGIDFFAFFLTKDGIIPLGTQPSSFLTFNDSCRLKTSANGYGCTAWVIYNENEDYLRCNDLDWSTKTKCN